MPKYPEFKAKPIKGVDQDDWGKLTLEYLNKRDVQHAKTNWLIFKPELIAKLVEPFINVKQMHDYKGENEDQIHAAANLIMMKKVPRPKHFKDPNDKSYWMNKKVANTDYQAFQKQRVNKINFKAIAAKKHVPVSQYDKEGNFIRDWDYAGQAEKELNLSQGGITQCCKGKIKSAYGYIWKYKEEQKSS